MDVKIERANIYLKKRLDKKTATFVGCAIWNLVPQLHARGLCRRAYGIKFS
jgi:hypothetical protein